MKLENFREALAVIRQHELDASDLEILAAIDAQGAAGEAPTIMKLPALLPHMSFGTLHARIKRMMRMGLLTKTVDAVSYTHVTLPTKRIV